MSPRTKEQSTAARNAAREVDPRRGLPRAGHRLEVVQSMNDFDAIVVGAGMGGLSTAAFLSMAGMKVAVFEKHDKPGGYVTSFTLHGVRFDAGIEALPELAPGDALGSFLSLWGVEVPSILRQENVRVFTDVGDYTFRDASLVEDFRAAFPGCRREVDAFFRINRRMMDGMMAGGPPRSPQEMSFLDKLAFGVRSLTKNPDMIRFGLKSGHTVIERKFGGGELGAAILAKVFYDVVYLSYAYRWEQVRRRRLLYPVGGMQALSDAVAGVTLSRAGRLFLKNGVRRILVEAGRAVGVEDETGSVHRADVVICNAPLPYALGSLLAGVNALDPLRKAVARRAIFPSAALVFLGLDESYDPGGHYVALSPSLRSVSSADRGRRRTFPSRWCSLLAGTVVPCAPPSSWQPWDTIMRTTGPAVRTGNAGKSTRP